MAHMGLIMSNVVLKACISILQYLSLPCAQGWGIFAFWKVNGMQSLNAKMSHTSFF